MNQPDTRILSTIESGLYYDVQDMPSSEMRGNQWANSWYVGANRSVQVGDRAYFFVHGDDAGFFARGIIIEAPPNAQIASAYPQFADLSTAYMDDGGYFDPDVAEMLFVAFRLDSIVEMWADGENKSLSIDWLAQQFDPSFINVAHMASGDMLPIQYVEILDVHWPQHVAKMADQNFGMFF